MLREIKENKHPYYGYLKTRIQNVANTSSVFHLKAAVRYIRPNLWTKFYYHLAHM